MRLWKRLALGLQITLLLASSAGHAVPKSGCEASLISRILSQFTQEASDGPLAQHFRQTPELFFNDGGRHDDAYPFFASNEFDWFKAPFDTSPTDVVVGFGTNSAWDIASRKRAKELVVADYVAGPLIAQRYILRPLLHIAKSPADFLLLLMGASAPAQSTGELSGLARYLSELLGKVTTEQVQQSMFANLNRLRAGGASEQELQAIMEYYLATLGKVRPGAFGVVRGRGAEENGDIANFFIHRYMPEALIQKGAKPAFVNQPEFSFLSSQTAFERFQKLYDKSLLAQTDYQSEEFYQRLKARGEGLGYTKYTFSLTNILDVSTMNRAAAMQALEAYRKMIYRIFPADKFEVLIMLTTNWRPPHGFLRIERGTRVSPNPWLFTPPRRGPQSVPPLRRQAS